MYNVAVIVAAGNGTRMGIEKSKMLLEIGGKTVLERSVAAFSELPEIDEVIVVCRECDIEAFSDIIKDDEITFVIGGDTRQQSVLNAVETVDECDYLVIHDGARPLVTQTAILNTLDKAQVYNAAATGVTVKDTLKIVDDDLSVVGTADRNRLVSVQTPQIFNFNLYKKALKKAQSEHKDYTDDCQLIEKLGEKVFVVLGDYDNIKITTKSDIAIAENILKMRGEL